MNCCGNQVRSFFWRIASFHKLPPHFGNMHPEAGTLAIEYGEAWNA
jgi:hypothetical protein